MSPAKFLFDQDFTAAAKAKPAIPLEQHEAQLHEAQTTGYLRGFAAARAEILTEAELSSAAALIEREPLAEISALAKECFRHLVNAPHVAVRVNETQHESVARRIEDIARARGLASGLVVLAESDIRLGDCRIEWADGGINRDRGVTEAAIDEAVSRYARARLADTPDTSRRTDR